MRIEEQEYTKNFDIRIWKRVLPFLTIARPSLWIPT